MNHDHTTTPGDGPGITVHYWTAGDERNHISLTALHMAKPAEGPLAALATRYGLAATAEDGGTWLLDVIQEHKHNPGSGWSCGRHGDDCDMDAFVSSHANPAWARITSAGLTDDAVYAELDRLYAMAFGRVAQ